MNTIKQLLGETVPSVIENPFNKSSICGISMFMYQNLFDPKKFKFKGTVSFRRGNTEGEQKFVGENMSDLYAQIYNFCLSLSDE
jgi:hypothetical protein